MLRVWCGGPQIWLVKMPEKQLKLLQINPNRSRIVMDEVKAAVRGLGCHIVAVSEPNLDSLGGLDHYLDTSRGAAIVDMDGVLGSASVISCSG